MELFSECSSGNDQYRFEHLNSRAEEPTDVTNLSTSLRSLVIIGQPLYTVPDMQYLKHLEDLWLIDDYIHNADQVIKCKQLKRLYLYSNVLSKVPQNMSCLQNLKVLWLAGNNIANISDYEFPCNLEELNLADNKIITIKGAFKKCHSLESLNLSGNPLQSIFEVCHLRVIKNLKRLSLYDLLYDTSIITKLCNYRSFVVNILPNLDVLDAFPVEDREIELTKIFYLNKHIFYAMMKMAAYYEYWACKEQQNSVEIEELRNIKKKLHVLSYNVTEAEKKNDTSLIEDYGKAKLILENELRFWESHCKNEHMDMEELLNVKISNLDLELQYFGNIKFQTFSKNSEVSAVCQELLKGFICPRLKKHWGVKGIDVTLVSFVINASTSLHERAEFMLDILEEHGTGELFMFCKPHYVQSSYETFYRQFRNSLLFSEADDVKKSVTQCFAIADKLFDEENIRETREKLYNIKRIASMGFFQSDNVYKRCDWNPTDSSHKCKTFTLGKTVNTEQLTPLLLIEYSYLQEEDVRTKFCDLEQINVFEEHAFKICSFENLTLEFKRWCTLTKLVLSHQNLSSFGVPEPFLNVTELDISYNNFMALSEICNIFPNIEVLWASFNEISGMPSYSFTLEYLKEVDLSWNSITSLFPTLQWLRDSSPKIEKLNLKYNVFTDLHQVTHDIYFVSRYLKDLCTYNLTDMNKYNSLDSESVYKLNALDKSCNIFELSEEQLEPKQLFCNTSWDEECCSTIKTSHIAVDSDGKIKCISLMGENQFQNLVFQNNVENVASLKITKNKLMETKFLQTMPNLIDVNLSFNLLTEINDSFRTLTNIVKLNLSSNYIRSLEGLSTTILTLLKVLDVSNNKLSNIRGIENAVNMEELYISFNQIDILENYLFIKQFKQLKIIDVRENDLHNMDILRNYFVFHLPLLQYINGSTVSEDEVLEASHAFGGVLDIEFLQSQYKYKDFKNMQHISVLNSSIKRASGIDSIELWMLQTLADNVCPILVHIYNKSIEEGIYPDLWKTAFIRPLQKRTLTKSVSLSGGQFHNLTSMNLENNGLVSISDLLPLGNLKFLILTGNQICKFGEAPESMVFKKLEEIHLNSNHIYNLEPLQLHRMPQLKTLFLQDNELTNVRGIERLTSLQHLILDNNRISRIQANYVRKLVNLKHLLMESNFIDTLEFLPFLKRIVKLYLRNNRIQDIKALSYFKYLSRIEEITFSGNPVCRHNDTYVKLLIYLPNINCVDGVKLETISTETAYYQ